MDMVKFDAEAMEGAINDKSGEIKDLIEQAREEKKKQQTQTHLNTNKIKIMWVLTALFGVLLAVSMVMLFIG